MGLILASQKQASESEIRKVRDYQVGLPARRTAVEALKGVLQQGRALDEMFSGKGAGARLVSLAVRDRALARNIAATTLRRKGQIDDALEDLLDKALPPRAGALYEILATAAAQLMFLDTAPHAAIGLAVRLAQYDRRARHFDKLVNAVLRRLSERRHAILARQDAPRLNTPAWLWTRWVAAYGEETARAIAHAHLAIPPLDVSVKSDPAGWAARLDGRMLPTGSVRLQPKGRVENLDGFQDGEWWVQDAGAALPARLVHAGPGLSVCDLCAAPGGKTAQLAAAGADVTAVDRSEARLALVQDNLQRLGLDAELIAADATMWASDAAFDAVLLDAPCSATGTIRRHPDVAYLKTAADIARLAGLQGRLLEAAAARVRDGGMLVYCTCSLEPEEGPEQVRRFLDAHGNFETHPVSPGEIAGREDWITPQGWLRTLPHLLDLECVERDAGGKPVPTFPHPAPGDPSWNGIDGFFAARLRKRPA